MQAPYHAGAVIGACKPFLQIIKIKYVLTIKFELYLNVLAAASLLRLQATTR